MCVAEPKRKSARLRAAVNSCSLRRPKGRSEKRISRATGGQIRNSQVEKVFLAEARDDFGREFRPQY
jgi:hypothetical protein